ncbi:MAG TPA: response regulator [Kofleriaceae bacterium]
MPRILVVDDQLALAETIADGLCDRGYSARALGTGREALAALERDEIDLVVTDLRMPEIDGLSVLEAARDIPVIMMTAYGAIDSAVEATRRGAFHLLTKPFKLDELVLLVERALR